MNKKIGLIVPIYNLSWMTINLFESIKACSNLKDFYFIVIDNGSTQEESDKVFLWLTDHFENGNNFYFSYTEKPVGFVKAVNEGIDEVLKQKLDYFFVLNNDTLVTKGWDLRLLKSLEKEEVGIVGPVSSPPNWRELPGAQVMIDRKLSYNNIKITIERWAYSLQLGLAGTEKEVKFLAFYCAGFKTKMVRKIGKLDTIFNLGLFDDDDYCIRALKGGWKFILRKDTYVHHYHRSTWIEHDYKYKKLLEENRKIFIKKHGFDPWKRVEKERKREQKLKKSG